MAKGQARDAGREAKWRDEFMRHGASGLSVRAFCERERLLESAFYAWRRTIQQRDTQRQAFVPVQVQTESAGHDAAIVVELRVGRVLRRPPSMPSLHSGADTCS